MSVPIAGLIALLLSGCGPGKTPVPAAPKEPPADTREHAVPELNPAAVAGVEDPGLRRPR